MMSEEKTELSNENTKTDQTTEENAPTKRSELFPHKIRTPESISDVFSHIANMLVSPLS